MIKHTGMSQDVLLKPYGAQEPRLFALSSMIFKVFTQIALIASLRYSVDHPRQLYLYQFIKFGYEFVVTFL